MAIQDDGKIVVAGVAGSDVIVVRFPPDGPFDNTFSDDGIKITFY